MQPKKKNLLDKIVKKDYNNELEEILEEKQFGENVKSTLLSILYKIEAAYKDLETVKWGVENKDEYISNILDIIKKDCNSIKIVRMNDKENNIPDKKTYIIDNEKKEIIAYPIERKILYAIAKIGKKNKIIKDDYFIISDTLSEVINVGNNISIVEPLRDFNGYSWTSIAQEIESVDYNLIYQNLRILLGYKFLNKWVKNNEFIIDYYEIFQDNLERKYGKENKDKIIDLIIKISILLSCKYSNEKNRELIEIKENIEHKIQMMQNKEQFIEQTTQEKIKIVEEIKKIDTILNNKDLLQEEYSKRNSKLPLEEKIFSMRILAKIMEQEREKYLKELEKINEMLNPQNFVRYKKEIEEKYELLKILNIDDKEKELDKLKIEFQKIFLETIKININKAETKQEIEKIIYDLRYYLLLPYNYEITIRDIEDIQEQIDEVIEIVIDKAIELKVIEKVSEDKKTNYEILKNIFLVRIIKLEDAYLKIIKEKDKYFIQIFDENIFEEKVEIQKPKALNVKPNKKISIMSH